MRIEDYALIGDCQTAALVGCDGSIDWLCLPTFSSDACFAKLLGTEENGFWKIAPTAKQIKSTRCYMEDSLVLETTHRTRSGTVQVIDFMPSSGQYSSVVRIVRGVKGKVRMRSELALRFSYGHTIPWVRHIANGIRAVAGPDSAELHTTVPMHGRDMRTISEFTMRAGESVSFVLVSGVYGDYDERKVHNGIQAEAVLKDTLAFWQKWSSKCKYEGPYRELVMRSLITLKALTYAPTGGIVAAPTTSLPELIGGSRNWDYRYCWLRDTTFTLLAFLNAGYREEARGWMHWLRRTLAGNPESVQIMYGILGERRLPESELPHLCGYQKSTPVRVGNDASRQLQLDIYGEVLDAFFWSFAVLGEERRDEFAILRRLVEHLETIWKKPDQGIWETRGGPQHFVYSKVMAWVAFDRAIRIAERAKFPAPLVRWRKVRDTIHREVCKKGFNKTLNSFTRTYGSHDLDASSLLIPLVGFLSTDDPRTSGTVEAVEKHLMHDGLVLRYNTEKSKDGISGGEGKFLACSFWLASNYKLLGRETDAMELFNRLAERTNDVGLISEEYDTRNKRMLGNFPQALSHIALVNSAYRLLQPRLFERHRASVFTTEAPRKTRNRTVKPADTAER